MSTNNQFEQIETALRNWREKEKTALKLSKLVGELRFDRSIEIVFFRHDLYDESPSDIINKHLYKPTFIYILTFKDTKNTINKLNHFY